MLREAVKQGDLKKVKEFIGGLKHPARDERSILCEALICSIHEKTEVRKNIVLYLRDIGATLKEGEEKKIRGFKKIANKTQVFSRNYQNYFGVDKRLECEGNIMEVVAVEENSVSKGNGCVPMPRAASKPFSSKKNRQVIAREFSRARSI